MGSEWRYEGKIGMEGKRKEEEVEGEYFFNCLRASKHLVNVGHGGTLVQSKPFDRRVMGLNPALAAT